MINPERREQMLAVERRQEILELLHKKGSVRVNDLAEYYNVGKETIRRDLKALSEEWGISVVYGGAQLQNSSHAFGTQIQENTMIQKRTLNYDLKNQIGKRAAELIEPGDIIALNSGSTVECVLNHIADKVPLSILTVNVNIAAKAAAIPNVEVYIPGGKIRTKSGMIIGYDAENYIHQFTVKKCFFGVSAISLGRQITHPSVEEVPNNRALLAISEQTYLLADHTKFNKQSLYKLARLDEMNTVITDQGLEDPYCTYFLRNGIDVLF
ncbi:MAG: DeoR/GlpR transcriptional regulator [Lachnospiraceae bacterium]|nr:DeoR/GlpR transcriptional regulator [Lachnospiraceae bacterium]